MSTFSLQKRQDLFPTPLFYFKVENFKELNEQLVRDSLALKASAKGIKRSNQHGWHSGTTLFELKEESFQSLCKIIVQSAAMATKQIAPKFESAKFLTKCSGWININSKGAYNVPHEHPGYCWSGSYYVKVPESKTERGGFIEFLDFKPVIPSIEMIGSPLLGDKYRIKPEEGLLLLFPSHLKHWVYPNEGEQERISIAFNIRYESKLVKAVSLTKKIV
ncbi:MAG: 2OG-Fe(II) oxygenase family protein [Polynucleobacter sp.]|jgi:uncharacterized protein (TIGR02466 family)|nr:2OG-Fe(II) oxygenase family protein [Polynucleobacter sp.]